MQSQSCCPPIDELVIGWGTMSLFGSLLGRKAQKRGGEGPDLPFPDQTHFIVGDLHGCLAQFEAMLVQIDALIGEFSLDQPRIVFVGDYIDRGPSSAQVLSRLYELTREYPDNVTCLLGNHEQMMLDFLDAPAIRHARWFRNGAKQTLMSFGINLPAEPQWAGVADTIAETLRAQMEPGLEDWLRQLACIHVSGNLAVVHASADPGRAIDAQANRVMIWGHPEFMNRPRSDHFWVAHGHVILDEPVIADSRISVDTGAYKTGILTAALILPNGTVEFIQST